MKKRVSLIEVAKKAGVSRASVSNILNSPRSDKHSQKMRDHVLKVAMELNYIPNRSAQAMRTNRTGIIGFVTQSYSYSTDSVENYNIQPFLTGLSHCLTGTARHVAMVETEELSIRKTEDLPVAIRQRFFDGLVVHFNRSNLLKHLLDEFDIPVVYWDCGVHDETNCISRDEYQGSYSLVEELVSRGFSKIGIYEYGQDSSKVSLPFEHFSRGNRLAGYADAMAAAWLPGLHLLGKDPDSLAKQLSIAKPEVLILQGSYSANPCLMAALTKLKWSVPDDISLVWLAIESRIRENDSMAGMSYDRYEAGRIAASMMLENLSEGSSSNQSVLLSCEFKEGATLGPPPAQS